MATRQEQLADAFVAVATANHYMVGIVEQYTEDELDSATQRLIDRSNAEGNSNPVLELALDLVEDAKRRIVRQASESVQTVRPSSRPPVTPCPDCGTAHTAEHECEPINWTYGK